MLDLRALARRLAMRFRRRQLERDLDEEMALHLELRAAEARAAGRPADAARLEARRRFGSTALAKDESRDAWALRWLDDLIKDLRIALRGIARAPGFTLLAILAMALGIAANSATLSVVDAVLLRPLPYAEPDRLVVLLHEGRSPVSAANFFDWRAQARSFSAMAAAQAWSPNLAGDGPAEHVSGLRVSSGLFPLLGVAPQLGSWPSADSRELGDGREAVISHGLWQRRFAGDPAIVGRPLRLDGESFTVAGVMPPGFRFAPFWVTDAEVFAPLPLAPRAGERRGNTLRVFARLAPGVSLDAARAEVAAITARLEREHPRSNRDVRVVALDEKTVGDTRPLLLLLLGAVGFVLLIACANVAHMLLARAAARQRELVVRAALGAGRARLVRQLLAESLLLAALGGLAGVALAAAALDLVATHMPALPLGGRAIALNGFVLAVMTAVTLAAGVAFGLAPALRATRVDVGDVLRDGRGGSSGAERSRARDLLIATQLALAVLLLAGAGVTLRSFAAMQRIDPGFEPDGVLSFVVSLSGSDEAAPGRRGAFYEALGTRLAALPGVVAVSGVNHLPLAGDVWSMAARAEGVERPDDEPPAAVYRVALPGYLATMGTPLVRGRDIAPGDRADSLPVVVVNERLAARLWPGEDPLGRRLRLGNDETSRTVVGVARDARQSAWTQPPEGETYIPLYQAPGYLEGAGGHVSYFTFVVRSSGDPAALAAPVRAIVRQLDGAVAVSSVATMPDVVAAATARPRFFLGVLGAFALAALVLAAVGIYGTTSHAVARRVRELGIRIALGATRGAVLRLLLGRTLALALAGAAVGVVAALGLGQLLSGLLYGVSPSDPLTLAAVAMLLIAVVLAASWLPVRRALRADPMRALRQE
jgi:predicted permease